MVELMVTLVILSTALVLGLITLTGYIPKQRLIASQGLLANVLERAQTEAGARDYWTCVSLSVPNGQYSPITASVWVDVGGNHGSSGACGDTGDVKVQSVTLKPDVELGRGPKCGNNIQSDCRIWFNRTGSPQLCRNSGNCGALAMSNLPASGCRDWSFEVVLSTPRLDTGNRSREVEAVSGGLIQIVKPNDRGIATYLSNSLATSVADPADGCE
jgi:Tfp pilus assembly protein FimT